MKTKHIKEQIKKEKKRRIEVDKTFINKVSVYCISNDIHMETVYKVCKVPYMDQMLSTMYDTTVKEYKLHEPTLVKIKDSKVKEDLNKLMEGLKIRL